MEGGERLTKMLAANCGFTDFCGTGFIEINKGVTRPELDKGGQGISILGRPLGVYVSCVYLAEISSSDGWQGGSLIFGCQIMRAENSAFMGR